MAKVEKMRPSETSVDFCLRLDETGFARRIVFKPAMRIDTTEAELRSKYTALNNLSIHGYDEQVQLQPIDAGNQFRPAIRVLFPPQRFVVRFDHRVLEFLEWKTSTHSGAGLHNYGNTCFLNAVLQCLTHTPPLVNYLQTGEHSKTCI